MIWLFSASSHFNHTFPLQSNHRGLKRWRGPNDCGLLHMFSCFWNVPALLLTCWLFCIFLQVSAWRLSSQLKGTLEGYHRSLWPLWVGPSTCPSVISTTFSHLLFSYTLITLCNCLFSCCLSLYQECKDHVYFISPLYPQNLLLFLVCSSCITKFEYMKSLHCIYAIGIAISWNYGVNERIVGKISCGTENLLIK